ncbi:YkvA family protein [Aeromonas hydrophila]|uniref:YkvA family protein n=1 Tax=Aeromonas hydrophila TaxID=644 RepID=UPI003989624A
MPPCIPPECEPFDQQGFWRKLCVFAKRAGRPFIETCLLLYYTSQKDDLPLWAKLLIYSALAYFISPIDAIPDVLPMGLTDDIAVLSAALASITAFIDAQIRARAARKMRDLFGQD